MERYVQIFFRLLDEYGPEQSDAAWRNFLGVLEFEGVEPDRMLEVQEVVLDEWEYS